ncbi:hypothetical protein JB92DRAFT_1981715 [Gautieria morchelliformis]|nr:hypothetical protein JB92DRAFT_1981715 [Gautieria morchelliformis]
MYLPFDVWNHIFCELPNNSVVQVMRVSSAWRNMANATPQLWRHIHIRHPHQFADPAGLSQWLKKSGQSPLDVVLKVPPGVTGLQPTLALLHDHVRRFRVLDIDVLDPKIADTILPSLALSDGTSRGNPASLLEELRISIYEDPDPSPDEHKLYFEHAFCLAPRLRNLTLSALRLPSPSSKFLSTVATFTITAGTEDESPSVLNMLDTIEGIPHLKYLKYTGYEFFSYQNTYSLDCPRIVLLPHLEAADVIVPGCGLDILQCLEALSLR